MGIFVAPLLISLASFDHNDLNDVLKSTDKITKLIVDCSLPLVTPGVNHKRHGKQAIYAKLPGDIKAARFCSKNAFDSWKRDEFSNSGAVHDNYRSKHRDYGKLLRKFLNKLEKLFWKLLKGKRSTTQMNAFLTDGKLTTDKNDICDMWANHFEVLGKPSISPSFDHDFFDRVATRARNIFASCQNELPGTLNEPLQYQEVFNIWSKLKPGVSGILIDHEHIRFGGPLWKLLHDLYQVYIRYFSKVQSEKLSRQVWSYHFSKAKAPKQTIKITTMESLFPTLCKTYEMIILNRLGKFASRVGCFSKMQFGFQEGSGCIEASFTILETINHMLQRGGKMFSCFLDVWKAFLS